MSDHNNMLTREEIAARDAVRSLSDVAPDPEFRAQMKSGFAAGTLQPRLRVIESKPRRRGWIVWGALAAAAAVTLIVWGLGSQQPAPNWKISSGSGEGIATINGEPISMRDLARAAGVIREGARVTTPQDGELQIVHDGMTIFITPGTDMRVPDRRVPDGVKDESGVVYNGTVAMGQIRITTGPEFQGNRLEIETPETRVQVTGTTLAIIRGPSSTCVCVLEGKVQIRTRGGAMKAVESGHRGTFLPGSDDAEFGEILDMERTKLSMFRDQARP